MEKALFFFCLFSYWIMQITPSDASGSSAVRVQMGGSISLTCSMRNRYEVAWYHFRSEELVLLISGEKDQTGRKLLTTYNQNSKRLEMTTDSWVTSVSLTISGVSESDLGIYFCGTKSDAPEMHFDKPFRLEIEGQHAGLFVTEEPNEDDVVTAGVTSKERMLMFGGVGLAVFVFFLTTVVAGGIIYHRGWQKGWKEGKHGALIS